MFESEFGSSMFGGSDSFDDDPDVQRMREEAAARKNKKGRRNKKFEGGGVTMKVKYKRKPKKYENGGKPPVVIKKDAREEIVKLNSQKLKSDMTEVYEEMKAKGIDGNSGAAGFIKNRMELDNFIEKAKADGLTNAQALARFKKQFKL
jgi:DNA-binding transcriptional regulator YhcF (GntR family)